MPNTQIEEKVRYLVSELEAAVGRPVEFAAWCGRGGLTEAQLGEEFGPLLEELRRRAGKPRMTLRNSDGEVI